MGYRANVIARHQTYGSTMFSQFPTAEAWLNSMYEKYPELSQDIHQSESEDHWEIPRKLIEKEIEEFEKLPAGDVHPLLEEEYQYIITDFKDALREGVKDDDFITLEWW